MAAETAQKFGALEAQAQVLMSVFTKAGHEAVAPAIIQPADVFLDCIGEEIRARTYVFSDQEGAELCLRPDLTVPTCRLHLERHADPATPAKYCYSGPAFRFQPMGADAAHPREFRQVGIERFGDKQREASDAATVALIINAIETAGVEDWSLHLGDLGLFRAVLVAAALPERWQKRLAEAFLRPQEFRDELRRLVSGNAFAGRGLSRELLGLIRRGDAEASEVAVSTYLDANGIELIGTRTLSEMTEHLMVLAEDLDAPPLDAAAARTIEAYVAVCGPAHTAGERIAELLKGAKGGSGAALDIYDRRLATLANAGVDLDRVTFAAESGRTLAYYTGFVFEVRSPRFGSASPLAGGGRYDGLMRAAGAGVDVPAVGAAIHSERLLSDVAGGRG